MTCRDHIENIGLLIDGELENEAEHALRAHLEACESCRDFEARERACWESVRSRLGGECCPDELKARLLACCDEEMAPQRSRRWITVLAPLAAAAAILIVINALGGAQDNDHGQPPHHFASVLEDLDGKARDRGVPILSSESLKDASLEQRSVEEARPLLEELFGKESPLIEQFLMNRALGAVLGTTKYEGTPVTSLLLSEGEANIGIFKLTRTQARLAHLAPYAEGETREVQMEHCPLCKVVAVSKGENVYLLISPHQQDHLDELVRKISEHR